jgi:hypothetical protein
LICQSLPGCLNILWTGTSEFNLHILSQYSEVLIKKFLNFIPKEIFIDIPPIDRVSVSGNIIIEVKNPDLGYDFLNQKLSKIKKLDYDKHRDFLYHINNLAKYDVKGIQILLNRLGQWRFSTVELTNKDTKVSLVKHFVSIGFEINTDAN